MNALSSIAFILAVLTVCSAGQESCSLRDSPFLSRLRDVLHIPSSATIDALHNATSGSTTSHSGWFHVRVVGTGKACYSKTHTVGVSETTEFGEFASSEAFINFYGYPECEVGDVGVAWGFIRAYVVAAAYERGEDCLARVISAVIEDPLGRYSSVSFGDVSVHVSGESVGEALALCET